MRRCFRDWRLEEYGSGALRAKSLEADLFAKVERSPRRLLNALAKELRLAA
jgi:hypothetical protein